jgi:5'-nucleotidase
MSKLNRRAFLRKTVALGAGATLMLYSDGAWRIALAAPGPETYQLRIVHTNDHHSRIEPTSNNATYFASSSSSAARFLGGVARRKTIFDEIRADPTYPNQVFLDAGDVFQGTLYFNLFNGLADLDFYNRLGYDAMTFGNHEFDKGDSTLANFIKDAKFPIVSANVTAAAPSALNTYQVAGEVPLAGGKFGPRIVLDRGGQKIGIFGLTTAETPNIASPSKDVTFDIDYPKIAQAQVDALTAAGCNIIIALTHIGYGLDLELAPQVSGIDVIIGGHSHTPLFLNPTAFPYPGVRPRDPADVYPRIVKDKSGNDTLVVTSWEWGKWIGDMVVGFDANGLVTGVKSAAVRPVWGEFPNGSNNQPRAPLSGEPSTIITPNAEFTTVLQTYKPQVDALNTQVIGTTQVLLTNQDARDTESLLGRLICEAFLDWYLANGDKNGDNPEKLPVIALTNGGGIRSTISIGNITIGNVREVLPFDNTVARVDVTGAQLIAALENGVSRVGGASGTGRFAQVAGMRYIYDRRKQFAVQITIPATSTTPAIPPRAGERIIKAEVLRRSTSLADLSQAPIYDPVDPTKKYRIITNNFVLGGGDEFFVFTPGGDRGNPTVGAGTNQKDFFQNMADLVEDYIKKISPVNLKKIGAVSENRIRQFFASITR